MTTGHGARWAPLRLRSMAGMSALLSATALALLLLFATPASAGQRVALVIGNGSYAHAPSLANCPECPEMVVVPAGSFTMGSPSSEEGRQHDKETPLHRVAITAAFAVGKYEVTRGEFARFVRATGHSTGNACRTYEHGELKERSGRGWEDPGYGQDGREGSVASLAKGRCVIRGLPVHLMFLRWPDGPVATPSPRSERTVRDRRRARRSGPRRQCRPGGRTSRPGPCAARASPRSP